jgi:hypothetical protein
VFLGLENINPENLLHAKKRQNKITEYRAMLLAWKAHGIITLAGYILGFPADTPESILADIDIIKRELPIDILEFFCLTPLPGSEDHQRLWKTGVAMDPDLNKYDIEHVCTAHPKMTRQEWEDIYQRVWAHYYEPAHIETLLKRAAKTGIKLSSMVKLILTFSLMLSLENVHPLQSGIFRQRHPSERRPGLARENALLFWPRLWLETVRKTSVILSTAWRLSVLSIRIARDPKRYEYMDQALTPVGAEDETELEMFTHTSAAKQAVAHRNKVLNLTRGAA